MAELRERFAELEPLGAALAALSVDAPERSSALSKQLALPFPLLCDPSRGVVEAWGLLNRAEKGGIAYPATFVLDAARVVRFRSLDRMASRVDLGALFAFLRSGSDAVAPEVPARTAVRPTLADLGRMTKNALRFGIRGRK